MTDMQGGWTPLWPAAAYFSLDVNAELVAHSAFLATWGKLEDGEHPGENKVQGVPAQELLQLIRVEFGETEVTGGHVKIC